MSFVGFSPPILLLAAVPAGCGAPETGNFEAVGNGWPRHVIDDSSLGADGVRTADLDGDGLEDVLVAVKREPVRYHRRTARFPPAWVREDA